MTLTPHHYAMLHTASAITDEVMKARGYASIDDPRDVQDLGFSKAQARTAPVLALPLWDVHGQPSGWQIRPDSPRQMKDGKVFKYETPKGGRLQLDVHPSVQPMLGDPQVPLWITEGVRKGDALVSHGACAIALMGGVWGFRGTNAHGGKVILPDWEYVALNGRLVYVAYDSDLATKKGVQAALVALWRFLRDRQALPARLQWPEGYQQKKWGVDDFLADGKTLEDLRAMIPPGGPLPATTPRAAPAYPPENLDWSSALMRTKETKRPIENMSNILLILKHHPDWQQRFWWDSVRALAMCDDAPVDDHTIIDVGFWLGTVMEMSVRSLRLIENCVRRACLEHPHDLLKKWFTSLAPWDGVERLTHWLTDVASVTKDVYGMELSRLIPVSMVARALDPGCQYRNVVILEGPEDSGKSKLVRTLASPEWYREYAVNMETKEAHMLLQGAWVAELGELVSLSRTEEAKLKSFITLQEDVYVPKYSNFAITRKRRTIFIGTVNPEEEYLKGQSGNSRFLPVETGHIDCALLETMRPQLFAEALVYYKEHPDDWWQLNQVAAQEAVRQREGRRQSSIYETDLPRWLAERDPGRFLPGQTSWPEIAEHYLHIDKEQWKDKSLQMQISQALRAAGWTRGLDRASGTMARYWRKKAVTTD